MKRSILHRLFATSAFVAATLMTASAHAGPGGYSSLVVFGDSLSDNGNNFTAGLYDPTQVITGNSYIPSYTYASHVYSNGPVWANDFASMLGLPLAPSLLGGTDYAFGGASTSGAGFPYSLLAQTSMYLGSHAASPDALYVIAGGGNNARAALGAIVGGAAVQPTIAAAAASFASDVGTMVDALQAAGAQHIIVWDTPNLGLAPAVSAGGPGAVALGSGVAAAMNAALNARLFGEAGVSTFDIYGLGTRISADPAAFGFTNAIDACGAILGADCGQYAYWDGIHPTSAAHEVIADSMFAVAVPEPETWVLMGLGLTALGLHVRRRARGATLAA